MKLLAVQKSQISDTSVWRSDLELMDCYRVPQAEGTNKGPMVRSDPQSKLAMAVGHVHVLALISTQKHSIDPNPDHYTKPPQHSIRRPILHKTRTFASAKEFLGNEVNTTESATPASTLPSILRSIAIHGSSAVCGESQNVEPHTAAVVAICQLDHVNALPRISRIVVVALAQSGCGSEVRRNGPRG